MSFAGHVFDMIQRDKQNRALMKFRRNRMRENINKLSTKTTSYPNNISYEVVDRIIKNKNERELREEQHFLFAKILLFSIVIILFLMILGIRYLF
jgi:NTP pyrophosphatase (non-canonical NTP hydrolase)